MTDVRHREERSFAELLGQLSEDVSMLMRQEVQLAKAEMSQKLSNATGNFIRIGSGAMVALAGGLTLVAAIVLGLIAIGLPAWLSALIVGGALSAVGYSMLGSGIKDIKHIDVTPHRTVDTLKDDLKLAKEHRS